MSTSGLVLGERKYIPKVKSILEEMVDNIDLPILGIIVSI